MEQLSLDYSATDALALGVRAFGYLSGDAALVDRLMAGKNRDNLPRLLSDPRFLVDVLDALIADETALAYFVGVVSVSATAPYEARRLLKQLAGGNSG